MLFGALAGALHVRPARAEMPGPWSSGELLGWLLLALAPLAVFVFWWAFSRLRALRRVALLGRSLDAAPDAVALVNAKNVYSAVNAAYGRMLETSPERVEGRYVPEVWGEDLYARVIRPNLRRCFAGESIHGQAALPVPAFRDKAIEVVYTPVRVRKSVRYAAILLLDVTRRVEAETALRNRENLYVTLVEGANSVILRCTADGRLTFMNRYGRRFFGYTEEEMLGRRMVGLITPETDSEGRDLRKMWRNVLEDIERYALNENENVKKNGERVWMLWSNRALRDEQGRLTEVLSIGQDISALDRSRRELEGLRQALNQSGGGIVVTDLDGRIRFGNPAWRRMHGVNAADDAAGGNIGEFFEPMGKGARLAELLARVHAEGGVQEEMVHLRRDLSTFTALTTMTLLRDPVGNPDGLVFVAVDTSERRRLLADLEHSRKRLKVIVDNIADIVFSLDPSGRFIYVSPAVRAMFGREPGELEGRHYAQLVHPEDVDYCEAVLGELREGKQPPRKMEIRGCRKDGGIIWLLVGLSAIRNPENELVQVVGVIRDMSERRQITEELSESRERFRELVRAIEEAYWLQEGRSMVYASPGFRLVFGLPAETVIGDPLAILEVVHPEDRAIARGLWDNRRNIWSLQDVTLRVVGPEGTVRWLRARTFPVVRDGLVVRTAGVAQDVTAYTMAVNDIRMAKEAAERANQVKSEFLARMGHEFRTPLNGVLGMLQLLGMDQELGETARQRVDEAERSARALQRLLDLLLEYVGLESCAGGEDLPFSVRDLLRGLAAGYAGPARERGLTLRVADGADLVDLHGDAAKIRRILEQLLDNAVKFTEPGGKVELRATQAPTETGALRTRFVVDDDGPGIPGDVRERIFEPFVQGDGSYTRRHGGTGLGLSIARRLSACLGAELRLAESSLGGTALELLLELPPA